VYLPLVVRQWPLFHLVAGTTVPYPPFEYVDDEGNIVGFDPDLLDAIARAAGFTYELDNTSWVDILQRLAAGEFDALISAVTITEERLRIVDFSDPYFQTGQVIVVRADDTGINGRDDLPGHFVGVERGTVGDSLATEIVGEPYVRRYDQISLAFSALAEGDIDAVVCDLPTAGHIIEADPELDAKIVGAPLSDEFYGIAVRKNQPAVLAAINEGLHAVSADGSYDAIYERWFGHAPHWRP
jgi:polar amino acid transport system substrate-binding protein